MKITSEGQVTMPRNVREELPIATGSHVEFVLDGDRLCLRRIQRRGRGMKSVRRMRGRGSVRMTTDQILALTRGPRWSSQMRKDLAPAVRLPVGPGHQSPIQLSAICVSLLALAHRGTRTLGGRLLAAVADLVLDWPAALLARRTPACLAHGYPLFARNIGSLFPADIESTAAAHVFQNQHLLSGTVVGISH